MSLTDLSESIRLELTLLRQLMDESADLLTAVRDEHPTPADRLAAATMLLSFYNGVEHMLRQVAEEVDDDLPTGTNARNMLLPQLAQANDKRPAVISSQCSHELHQYLKFRESFRYGHFFQLTWETLAPLAVNCPVTLTRLENELADFQATIGAAEAPGPHADLPAYWTYPRQKDKPSAVTAVYVLGLGLVLLLGIWLGICGYMIYGKILAGEGDPKVDSKLLQEYIELAQLPKIPTMSKTPAQFLPDEKWSYRLQNGELGADGLREYTGSITGMYSPNPSVQVKMIEGRISQLTISPQLYRFEDGRLSRYEVNPRRGDEGTFFHEIWQLNRAGQIVHLSTWNDRQWSPKWLPVGVEPLDAGRWELFWAGNRLVMEMHTDIAGLPQLIRVRNGDEFTAFVFEPDGTAEVTQEPAP